MCLQMATIALNSSKLLKKKASLLQIIKVMRLKLLEITMSMVISECMIAKAESESTTLVMFSEQVTINNNK